MTGAPINFEKETAMLGDLRSWWANAPKPQRILAAVVAALFFVLLLLAWL